jgi:hypothetical protein
MLALRVLLALGAVVGVLWFVQKRVTGHQLKTRAGDPLNVVARRGVGAKASVVRERPAHRGRPGPGTRSRPGSGRGSAGLRGHTREGS